MDKKLYFGTNLKMYKNVQDTTTYLTKLEELTRSISRNYIHLFVIPSYTSLPAASECISQKYIQLGAQNMCWEEEGQFTGEISPLMLEEQNIRLVMIGHSERRHVFGECDPEENKKVLCALQHDFTALLCIGETLEEKNFGISDEVLRTQLKVGLHDVSAEQISQLWIAYEPVWAIGVNGIPATVEYAEEKHTVIKNCLLELFGASAQDIPVLYGGSVNPGNSNKLIVQPHIDGLFVGRSAWQAEQFYPLITDAMQAYRSKS